MRYCCSILIVWSSIIKFVQKLYSDIGYLIDSIEKIFKLLKK